MELLLSEAIRPHIHTHMRVHPHVTINSGAQLSSAFLDKITLIPGSSPFPLLHQNTSAHFSSPMVLNPKAGPSVTTSYIGYEW